MEWVWTAVFFVVLGTMAFGASRIEPHWVAKDRSRFIANAQPLDQHHAPRGRWREVRAMFLPDGALQISQRRRVAATKPPAEIWTVVCRTADPPRRGVIGFLLKSRDSTGAATHLVIRVPKSSKVLDALDAIASY